MNPNKQPIYVGTDSGATTSKTGGIYADGSIISTHLRQSSTNAHEGTDAVVQGWIEGIDGFLEENHCSWDQIQGAGLAIPGPYKAYGILDRAANLPDSFEGWNFYADFGAALAAKAGRSLPLVVGNDGNYGGVAEALAVRGEKKASVLMLAPGSGLGGAFVDAKGLCLDGDTLAGMEIGHMPAAIVSLGAPVYACGCGRDWGCIEPYTTISGLPQLLRDTLKNHPDHELAHSRDAIKTQVLSLRDRAQKGDPLALEIFDFQAKALGMQIATLAMALDPEFVVIGGGLLDPGSTTPEFRDRYLTGIREAARPYLWPPQRSRLQILPATLGELSQAIGAALMALASSAKP